MSKNSAFDLAKETTDASLEPDEVVELLNKKSAPPHSSHYHPLASSPRSSVVSEDRCNLSELASDDRLPTSTTSFQHDINQPLIDLEDQELRHGQQQQNLHPTFIPSRAIATKRTAAVATSAPRPRTAADATAIAQTTSTIAARPTTAVNPTITTRTAEAANSQLRQEQKQQQNLQKQLRGNRQLTQQQKNETMKPKLKPSEQEEEIKKRDKLHLRQKLEESQKRKQEAEQSKQEFEQRQQNKKQKQQNTLPNQNINISESSVSFPSMPVNSILDPGPSTSRSSEYKLPPSTPAFHDDINQPSQIWKDLKQLCDRPKKEHLYERFGLLQHSVQNVPPPTVHMQQEQELQHQERLQQQQKEEEQQKEQEEQQKEQEEQQKEHE